MNAKTKAAENATKREGTPSFYSPGFLDSYYPVDWRVIARAAARRRYQKPGIWNPPSIDDRGRAWRWLESVNGSGLIVVCENATKRANRDTTGYYTRSDGGDPIHGVVLATRNEESPKARFFAAISDYDNPGAYRILWEAEDSLDDAIRTADHIAGESAEEARDYDAAHTAGRAWADFGEGIKTLRKEALAILKDRKAAHGSPILCAVIREKVESLVSEIADMRKRRARLADGQGASDSDHWSQFYTGDKRLRAAFNDGAESPVLTV
jgi:hypothetical protein